MTANADEPPVVGLDRGQTQTYAQAAMALGWMLRERRQQRGRLAWSDAEHAARAHDEVEDLVRTPPVRPLTPGEARDRGAWADVRSVTDQRDELRVRIRPTDFGRWVLDAEILPLHRGAGDDGGPEERMRVQISCDTATRARDLADELAAAGPDRDLLAHLAGHTQGTNQRRRAARHDVTLDREQWLETVAEAAYDTWSPDIAQKVVDSGAFGAFVRHTRTLAERGYDPADVLARISGSDLDRADDAGALAAWFVNQLTQQLVVLDSTADTPDIGPLNDTGDPEPVLRDIPRADVDLVAVEALVRDAAPSAAEQLIGCRAWPTLAATISDGVRDGQPVARMLAGLPQDLISQARKPAAYTTYLLRQAQADQREAVAPSSRTPSPPPPRPRRAGVTEASIEEPASLDPASAVDRIVLDRQPAGATDPTTVHNAASANTAAAADRVERSAGPERTHPEETPSLIGQGQERAEVDDNLAAGYRAGAAEEPSAAAAALRAEVPLTPTPGADPTARVQGPRLNGPTNPAPTRSLTQRLRRWGR